MGYLFLFFCSGMIFDLGHMLSSLLNLNWPLNESPEFHIVGLLTLILLGYGLVEARRIRIRRISITTPKLASGSVTIAQISDMHLGIILGDEFLERVLAKLREIKPDIVVATGDIVDGQGDDFEALARHFHTYAPSLGAYAVTGNHEYYAGLEHSLRFLRSAGFTVLRGESAKAGGIVLVGVDDPTVISHLQPPAPDPGQLSASINANEYVVLLKHQPLINNDLRFDLQLSGHVHGGQIFPFVYLTRLTYRFGTGLSQLSDGRLLYVSAGTGTWGPPIRLFAPPEITLITIASENISP
jgi:predicted MPP superfamily phosphohydrolase